MLFAVLLPFLSLSYNYNLLPFQHCSLTFFKLLFRLNAPHLSCVSHPSVPFLLLLSLTCCISVSFSDLLWKISASPLCTGLFIYSFLTLVTGVCVLQLIKRRSLLLYCWPRLLVFLMKYLLFDTPTLKTIFWCSLLS